MFSSSLAFGAANAEFTKGIDFTGLTAITASQLNQLVDNAKPSANRGLVIVSATTPDTTNYVYMTNYLWKDISVSPPALKYWTGSAWGSATIGTDSVTSNSIVDGAVITSKIATNAVTRDQILDNEVVQSKIGSLAVSEDKIAAGAVTSAKIADGTIAAADMAANSVVETNIANNSITSNKLAAASVTPDKLAFTLGTAYIAGGAVVETNLADNIISQAKIKANSVVATNIVDATITTNKLGFPSIAALAYYNGITDALVRTHRFSSVTRHAAGRYTFTFTDAMPNTNYVVNITAATPTALVLYPHVTVLTNTTAAFSVWVYNQTVGDADVILNVTVY